MALWWAPISISHIPGPSLASPSEREPSKRLRAQEGCSPILHKLVIYFFTSRSRPLSKSEIVAFASLQTSTRQKRIPIRMKRSLALLVVSSALAATPGIASASPVCQPGQTPGVPPLYCIPPAPPATPAAAAHATSSAGARYLSTLTPSGLAAKAKIELSAFASGPGTITIVLKAKLHGRTVVIGTGKATVSAAGTSTIELSLTKAGMTALTHRKGTLKVTLTVTFKPASGKAATAKSTATLK
jgi:hypothetical protein